MADIMVWLSGNSNVTGKHLWQGVAASWYLQTGAFRGSEMKERRWRDMTAYEIISIFLGVLSLLIAFGSLLIAIIAFLDRKNKRK